MITSCFNKWDSDKFQSVTISICDDKNKRGELYKDLVPKKKFYDIWKNNIGKIPEIDNNIYFIREYFKEVLFRLDPEKVYNDLRYEVVLCAEENEIQGHIVAGWLSLLLGALVADGRAEDYYVERSERPSYIKDELERIMKEEMEMYNFHSVKAAYLYKQSELLEDKADLVEKMGGCGDGYRQGACYLRCDADMAEDEYCENLKQLKLTNN